MHTYTKHSFGIFSEQVKWMANFLHEINKEKNWVTCFYNIFSLSRVVRATCAKRHLFSVKYFFQMIGCNVAVTV
jgi:hypothetical protein